MRASVHYLAVDPHQNTEPIAICGMQSWSMRWVVNPAPVTCPECLAKMKPKED